MTLISDPFYHGTKADLETGSLLSPGFRSNFRDGQALSWIYFTQTVEAATWGAELALGDRPGRIYIVEPTGPWEDDPNLTDKKFPGNPTRSYRSRAPLKIVAELLGWQGHSPEQLRQMRDGLARLKAEGRDVIID